MRGIEHKKHLRLIKKAFILVCREREKQVDMAVYKKYREMMQRGEKFSSIDSWAGDLWAVVYVEMWGDPDPDKYRESCEDLFKNLDMP